MANEKFDSIVDRAVDDAMIASLRRREQELTEDIDFLRRFLAGEFDKPADDDDDDYIEREREVAEDIAYILPFYGDEEGDVDDWLEDESED